MEIRKKDENGIEFYTVELTGQSGMSQSGLALLAGIDRKTLRNLIETLGKKEVSKWLNPFIGRDLTLGIGDNPIVDGKAAGNLKIYRSSFCAAVLKHYASEPESNPVAIQSSLRFMEMGIDSWIQNITGWDQRSRVPPPHTNVYVQRVQHMRDHTIADDVWCVFREASELLLIIEKDWRVPINDYDLLDGSIGRKWSDYRKRKDWAREKGEYIHQYRDQRDARPAAAYSYDEIPHFKLWLRDEYTPTWLPKYLTTKYGRQATRLIYSEIGKLTDEIMKITDVSRLRPKGLQEDTEKLDHFLASRQVLDEKSLRGDN